MKRGWWIVAIVITLVLLPQWAWAADPIQRGPGFYLAWWKLLLWWLLFLVYVRLAAWLDRDLYEVGERFGYDCFLWNPIYVLVGVAGILIGCVAVPIFAVGYPLAWVAVLTPWIVYVVRRNQVVMEDMRVFTPKHILHVLRNIGRREKTPMEVKLPYEEGPPVVFNSEGPNQQANQVAIIAARNSPGYVPFKTLVADAMEARADRIAVDIARDAVRVQYDIDGVWQAGLSLDRETADHIVACCKTMSHANPNDRRSRQTGHFSFTYPDPKHKVPVEMLCQGTPQGERLLLKLDLGMKGLDSLEKIGMRPGLRDRVTPYLKGEKGGGIILISAMPNGGFTTTWYAVLKSMDRLLRDFIAVEPIEDRLPYVENVEVVTFDRSKGESPDQLLPKVILKQPDVYVLPDFVNAETIRLLCSEALDEGRLVLGGVKAKDAVDALVRVLALKPPIAEFTEAIKLVVNVRLIRKLSETCKQPYQPPPQLLQKLGLPPDRVRHLYREWQPAPDAEVNKKKLPPGACEICGLVGPSCRGLWYVGRTGIFEVLEVTDDLRQALRRDPRPEVLRQVARKSGHRGLQEEGVLLVAQGVTSLTELQRVMKLYEPATPTRPQTKSGS